MLSLLGLGGCGPDKVVSTQVAARVNSDEITIHQVNDITSKLPGFTADNAEALRQAALERLIDQQLAVEQAVENKLDRSPEVVNAIEAAKRQILAQAYLQQAVLALPKPTKADVRQYYDDHPELFAKRQQYELRALSFKPDADLKAMLQDMNAKGKPMDEVLRLLESRNVAFTTELAARSSDQLPMEILPKFAKAQAGAWLILDTDSAGFQIVRVDVARPTPVDLTAAAPRIEQYLFNQTTTDFMKAELLRLRKLAKIEYLGTGMAQGSMSGAVQTATPESTQAAASAPKSTSSVEALTQLPGEK
jgi:EpsD family peptidyl-prolyl cis-trans isomerase